MTATTEVLVVAFLLLVSAPALAEKPLSEAQDLFNEGRALFEAGKLDAACDKLQASVDLDRKIGAVINLARCHAAQGRTASAWRGYLEVAQRSRAAGQTERADGAAKLASDLEGQLSKLTIEVDAAVTGLEVHANDELVDPGHWNKPVPFDPGKVIVKVTAPKHVAWSTEVVVKPAGDTVVLRVPPLEPETGDAVEGDEDGWSGMRIAGVAIGAAGIALVGVGAAFGGLTLSEVADAEDDPALCPDKRCTPAGRDQIDGARTKGIVATVLLGVGALAIGGGVTLFVLGGSDQNEGALVVLPGGLAVVGRF